MPHRHGRPYIPEPLKDIEVRNKITLALAKYVSMEEVHAEFQGSIPLEEFEHYFNLDTQQDLIEQTRHSLAEKLPIYSEDWCLTRLNEIAVNKEASAAEVLSAIRTRNALLKGSVMSDQDFIDSVTGDIREDTVERADETDPNEGGP